VIWSTATHRARQQSRFHEKRGFHGAHR
jgi:hypothetical protein